MGRSRPTRAGSGSPGGWVLGARRSRTHRPPCPWTESARVPRPAAAAGTRAVQATPHACRATEPAAHLSVVLPEDLEAPAFLVSPDGRTILVRGRPRNPASSEEERHGIYLRSLDDYALRLVPGSRGVLHACFSPDGRWLAVVAPQDARSTKRFLWKVPVDGSASAQAPGLGRRLGRSPVAAGRRAGHGR